MVICTIPSLGRRHAWSAQARLMLEFLPLFGWLHYYSGCIGGAGLWLFGCLLMAIPFLQTFLLFIPSSSRIPTGGQNPINSGHISPVPRTHSTITSLAHSTAHSPSNSAAPMWRHCRPSRAPPATVAGHLRPLSLLSNPSNGTLVNSCFSWLC